MDLGTALYTAPAASDSAFGSARLNSTWIEASQGCEDGSGRCECCAESGERGFCCYRGSEAVRHVDDPPRVTISLVSKGSPLSFKPVSQTKMTFALLDMNFHHQHMRG